jgi:hypothetical protein
MEDSTHATVDAFLKELREGRDPKADAAFDEIWNCNDPVQMKEYEQKELAEIVAARKAEKSRKHIDLGLSHESSLRVTPG